jgi:hypothetical protein
MALAVVLEEEQELLAEAILTLVEAELLDRVILEVTV